MTTAARHDSLETTLNPRVLRIASSLDDAGNEFASALRRFALRTTADGLAIRVDALPQKAGDAIRSLAATEPGVTFEEDTTVSGSGRGVSLAGSASVLARLFQDASRSGELSDVARVLEDTLQRAARRVDELPLRDGALRFGSRPLIMGIVNRTPDSFSDGGCYTDLDAAIEHARALVADGADVIDIGGESTRPGAAPVGDEEECARVVPLIRELAASIDVPISIDTTKPAVAERALEAGARIVNDVSGLAESSRLAEVASAHDAPLILMHRLGTPRTMQSDPQYSDVLGDLLRSLRRSIETAERAGLARERLVVDPGIGFGKTFEHNIEIFRGLDELRALGLPILVGASRKAFLGKITGRDAEDRDVATLATVTECAQHGIEIVRVHDVRGTREVLAVFEALHARDERRAGAAPQ